MLLWYARPIKKRFNSILLLLWSSSTLLLAIGALVTARYELHVHQDAVFLNQLVFLLMPAVLTSTLLEIIFVAILYYRHCPLSSSQKAVVCFLLVTIAMIIGCLVTPAIT